MKTNVSHPSDFWHIGPSFMQMISLLKLVWTFLNRGRYCLECTDYFYFCWLRKHVSILPSLHGAFLRTITATCEILLIWWWLPMQMYYHLISNSLSYVYCPRGNHFGNERNLLLKQSTLMLDTWRKISMFANTDSLIEKQWMYCLWKIAKSSVRF